MQVDRIPPGRRTWAHHCCFSRPPRLCPIRRCLAALEYRQLHFARGGRTTTVTGVAADRFPYFVGMAAVCGSRPTPARPGATCPIDNSRPDQSARSRCPTPIRWWCDERAWLYRVLSLLVSPLAEAQGNRRISSVRRNAYSPPRLGRMFKERLDDSPDTYWALARGIPFHVPHCRLDQPNRLAKDRLR